MFIQTEATPNPLTIKFIPGVAVLATGTLQMRQAADAANSPLAQRLFKLDGVAAVFLGHDFISVTKTELADWQTLKTFALAAIMDHYLSGQPVMEAPQASVAAGPAPPTKHDHDPIVKEIKELLETRVRPLWHRMVATLFSMISTRGLFIWKCMARVRAAPVQPLRLKNGIENMLKHYIPEVQSVQAVQ